MPRALLQNEIQQEHAMLSEKLSELRNLCEVLGLPDGACRCDEFARAECADRFISEVGGLLGYMVEHFRHEEKLMKDFGLHRIAPKLFGEHVEAHASMSETLSELVGSLEDHHPYPHLTGLVDFIAAWLHDHVATLDEAFLNTVQSPAWSVS